MFARNPQCSLDDHFGVIIHPGCAEDTTNVTNAIKEYPNWTLV